ncbi:MAG: PSD1 domain-containing protein [Verrucomicrobiaceae bacterium]|nr:PSD1 domain-containing protein [Verrucomicrobiaceae bacterium]
MPRMIRPAALLIAFAASSALAAEPLSFNRDIRPILSENCFACHGFDSKKREAELRLDTPEGAYTAKDGAFPIKPGDLAKSEVWQRIITTDEDDLMPPPKSHKKLTQKQKDTLKLWIEQGAGYQKHWAFELPRMGALQAPSAVENRRSLSEIDVLLADRLAKDKLTFADEADKETLIRRVSFTLTGLPPTLAEVDAYLKDGNYEAMVDRYMKSPRFGEEMARHWLDVARYADTHGLHLDNERSMWAYRDWVVRAFNENLPFDQFTVWQIAGDQLPNATPDQITATGFSRCNVTTSEGGAIDEEYRHLYAVDRAATLTTAWLGLTGGCAQCHDHKYDPLTTAEFYSLYAFFYSSADPPMDKNISSTEPFLRLPTAAQQKALDDAIAAENAALKALDDSVQKVAYSEKKAAEAQSITQVLFDDVFAPGLETKNTTRNPSVWLLKPEFGAKSGQRVLRIANGQFSEENVTPPLTPVVLVESPRVSVWARIDPLSPPRVLCLSINGRRLLWGDAKAFEGLTYFQENAIPVGELPKPGVWTQLRVDPVAVLGLKPGTRLNTISLQQVGGAVVWDRLEVSGKAMADKHALTSFATWWKQVSSSKKNPPDVPAAELKTLMTAPDKVTDAKQREALLRFYLARVAQPVNDEIAKRRIAWETAKTLRAAADSAIPGTFVFRDAEKPRDTFIAMRGAYNKLGDKVEPTTPAAFHPLKKSGARATRLDLANWLVAPENPMTARVTVNRFWQQVFGIGLVKTSHDFGSQGEPPSHPELLDDLAVRFQKSGWNVKQLLKQFLMTKAFKQASPVESNLLSLDPDNRLLARGPRIRLDAEQIRDNALFVSGLINLEMGGRGVRTYQPPNIWEPVGYGDSNTRYYLQDHGPSLYRRSLYSFLKRTAPPPFMSNFDAPNREQSCTRRERSNTPMQALQLLNDVQHFEAARALAERVIAEGGQDDSAKLNWLFRTVLSRKPDAKEFSMLTAALAKQRKLYQKDPKAAEKAISVGESTPKKIAAPAETAAWTLIANLVLNLDETVTRN